MTKKQVSITISSDTYMVLKHYAALDERSVRVWFERYIKTTFPDVFDTITSTITSTINTTIKDDITPTINTKPKLTPNTNNTWGKDDDKHLTKSEPKPTESTMESILADWQD